MHEVVAFIGRAGSGKDYQCSLLVDQGYKKLAFADALRDIAFSSLALNKELSNEQCMEFYDWFKKNNCISVHSPIHSYQINFRQFLEYLGTQGIRKYCPDFWVQALTNTIKNGDYGQSYCISDMRFINEYKELRKFVTAYMPGYKFRCVFCNYKSDRYQETNNHDSAKLSNTLVQLGYQDLQELHTQDIERVEDLWNQES